MAIPSTVVGAGNNSTAQNVFKVTFSQALSAVPTLEAWDDFNFNTTAHEIFTGTAGNGNLPMISAVATTDATPASATWKPASATSGGATINRLKGTDYYVNLSAAAPGAGESVLFNLCWEIPYDATVTASELQAVFLIRFSYSGSAPILTWYFNDNDGGGSEATPVWTQLTPGSGGNKLKPADSGCSSSYIVLHKPPSGIIDNGELWVVTS